MPMDDKPDINTERGKRRHRLLSIITRLDMGGSAMTVMDIVKFMDGSKYEMHFMCGSVSQLEESELAALKSACASFTVEPELRRDPSPVHDLKALLRIYRFIRRGRFDIVHTHTSKAGFIGRLAARLAGVPCIVHCTHGHVFYGFFGKFKTKIYVFLEKIGALVSDRVLCLTALEVEDHLKLGIGRRELFEVVPSGVHTEQYAVAETPRETVRSRLGIPEAALVVGAVGRLDPVKGVRHLVDAFAQLKGFATEQYLLLVGDGEERTMLETRARELGVGARVVFTGLRRDVPDLLHVMDIYALPSLNEGYGRVLIEAMSAGLPVVASSVGGVPSLIRDGVNGLLVPPAEPDALAAAVTRLAQSPDLARKIADAGKASVDENCSVAAMNRKIELIYSEILSAKRK